LLHLIEPDPTGIKEIKNEQLTTKNDEIINGKCYDLSGRQIANGQSSYSKLPRGIYVAGGKKMVNSK